MMDSDEERHEQEEGIFLNLKAALTFRATVHF